MTKVSFDQPALSARGVRVHLHNHYGMSPYIGQFIAEYCGTCGCMNSNGSPICDTDMLEDAYCQYLQDIGALTCVGIF